jgi:aminomethyltransferase
MHVPDDIQPKKTPLYEAHLKMGARMTEFGGWIMPVEYSGIIDEHLTVRSKIGVFDLSHMGEIFITGKDASNCLQKLITNDLSRLYDGKALYSPMCKPDGGIVDDLVIYRFSENRYMMVVNAANIEKDYAWILENASLTHGTHSHAQISNRSQEIALVAVQGRLSESSLQPLASVDLSKISYYHFAEGHIADLEAVISRTGYTGEDGFELYAEAKHAEKLWEAVMEAAKKAGAKPIGLGARDTLRLEMKYALYGNDIDESTSPLEAGLSWTVALDKGDFIGREALLGQKKAGLSRRLVGFKMSDRGIARSHYPIFKADSQIGPIGMVTSGSPSPSLKENIGLGYVKTEFSNIGTEIEIEIRGRRAKAVVVKTPFYKR